MVSIDVLTILLNRESDAEARVCNGNPVTRKEGVYDFGTYYARSKNGSIRTYSVIVTDYGDRAVMRTRKRTTLDGAETEDSYTFTEGVNIGKSNESSYLDVAFTRARHAVSRLRDAGFTDSVPGQDKRYNTDASGNIKPMLAIGFDQRKVVFPCIVQPKYDGVRCIVSEDSSGGIHIVSRNGKPYTIPHLEEWARSNRSSLPLDGELYCHEELTFQEIVSAVKRLSPITEKIRYVVYDVPVEGMDNSERQRRLHESVPYGMDGKSPVYVSPSYVAKDMDELNRLHDTFVSDGYEGAIIRNMRGMYEFGFRSGDLIKLKRFVTEEFEVSDVIEATGRDAGTAIFVLSCEAGAFNAKPQGSRELRAQYLRDRESIMGKMATVQYQGLSDEGIPRFPSALCIRDYE